MWGAEMGANEVGFAVVVMVVDLVLAVVVVLAFVVVVVNHEVGHLMFSRDGRQRGGICCFCFASSCCGCCFDYGCRIGC